MKKTVVLLTLLLSFMTMKAAVKIDRIEPTNWYVGLKNPSLQLMVYGKDIKNADVTTDYPGVKIDSLVRLDSPNYLLVYLNLDGAQPGEMKLNFTVGKQKKQVKYLLKARDEGRGTKGIHQRRRSLYAHARPLRKRLSGERQYQDENCI